MQGLWWNENLQELRRQGQEDDEQHARLRDLQALRRNRQVHRLRWIRKGLMASQRGDEPILMHD